MKHLADIADRVMPRPLHQDRTWKADGNTDDIIDAILSADEYAAEHTRDLADYLKGNTSLETLRNVWFFVRHNIKYRKDRPGHERVKVPAKTWADRYGDCKSMSVFIMGILKNLKIPARYRFVAYEPGPVTHVYVVARPDRYGRDIILDAVNAKFDHEENYHSKKDIMTKISTVHGLPGGSGASRPIRPVPPAKHIPFSVLSEGEARLMLMDRSLQIGSATDASRADMYEDARSLISTALSSSLHRGGLHNISGRAGNNTYLKGIISKIKEVETLRQPAQRDPYPHLAFIGEPHTIDIDFSIPIQQRENEANAKLKQYKCSNQPNRPQCKKWRAIYDAIQIEKILNQKWEKSGYGVLYNFTPTRDANQFNTVAVKRQRHVEAISGLSAISLISRKNIEIMAANGIRANGIQKLPQETWEAWRDGLLSGQESKIGEPVTLAIIITAITTALVFASDLLKVISPEAKVQYALPQTWDDSVAPQRDDIDINNPVTASAGQGLGLAALAAGAFFLLK